MQLDEKQKHPIELVLLMGNHDKTTYQSSTAESHN
jgi:hypothetical protein